jgi:DNA recombination protein RmuC
LDIGILLAGTAAAALLVGGGWALGRYSRAPEIARLQEREKALVAQLANEQRFTTEFENIATRILKTTSSDLSANSKTELAAVVAPLETKIGDFQKKVEDTYSNESREVLTLRGEVKALIDTTTAVGSHADDLAKALRGDRQMRGRWGEITLERILEDAGLTAGREYIAQGEGMGLKSETGSAQKPDVVVLLPENRTIVIDSKAPLTNYERLIAAQDDAEYAACGKDFVRDVKAHIDGLAGKRYQDNEKLVAHDYVLMFVPIEGAFAAALTLDPELLHYASGRGVAFIGPMNLLTAMSMIARLWRYERQGQNSQEIARLAGELCDKFSASLADLNVVAQKMNDAMTAHHSAVKRLSTGRGNALSLGERIRELGVKSKPMPAMLIDGVRVTAETGDFELEPSPTKSDGFEPTIKPFVI